MNAGRIEVTFEGLCAVFTKHLPEHRLMVGLVGVWGADDVIHVPTLSISEEGVSETTVYSGRSCRRSLSGDVYLRLLSDDSPIANDIEGSNANLLDVEGFYSEGTLGELDIDPQKCQARLHFGNGTLSQMKPTRVVITDSLGNPLTDLDGNPIANLGGNQVTDSEGNLTPLEFTYNVMLEVPIPEMCYPVLHFDGEADDFIFKANRNYIITITSLPQPGGHTHALQNHFQYFYRLASSDPAKTVVPNPLDEPDNGGPWCMLGGFGDTEY